MDFSKDSDGSIRGNDPDTRNWVTRATENPTAAPRRSTRERRRPNRLDMMQLGISRDRDGERLESQAQRARVRGTATEPAVRRTRPFTTSTLRANGEVEDDEEESIADINQAGEVEEEAVAVDIERVMAPILDHQGRRLRGVSAGDRVELADRLDPEVPGPLIGPLPLDGSDWGRHRQAGSVAVRSEPLLHHVGSAGAPTG